MLVCIDPGHGGSDPGARGLYRYQAWINEKEVNLQISRRLATLLERLGYRVIMTRNSDVTVPLDQRARIANEAGADLFLSIHANAALDQYARGTEVLYNPARPHGDQNYKLAASVYAALADTMIRFGVPGRGLKERTDLYVLNATNMPACLIEVAFMTNPSDLEIMMDPDKQQEIVRAIAAGLPEPITDSPAAAGSRIIPLLLFGGVLLFGWWYTAQHGSLLKGWPFFGSRRPVWQAPKPKSSKKVKETRASSPKPEGTGEP